MLLKLIEKARPWTTGDPWSTSYALARSLLAIGTACTLAFNSLDVLFIPAVGAYDYPICATGIWNFSIFCIVARHYLELARWIAVAILILIATGWRPRFTAPLHFWISYSLFTSSSVADGGDQVTLVLTTLLLPICLVDGRRWQWLSTTSTAMSHWSARLLANSALFVIRVQVAAIYFVSAISKMAVAEWGDGTALYYWALYFDLPNWLTGVFTGPVPVIISTWGAIVVEIALASMVLVDTRIRKYLLGLGLIFHFLIALMFGLWSFSIAMSAGLLLALRPDCDWLSLHSFPGSAKQSSSDSELSTSALLPKRGCIAALHSKRGQMWLR
jgi:antimicrobial peptide system SdpB family protein